MQKISREIWAAFRSAQTEATFAPIYDATRRLVYTVCYRILGDDESAQDAYQATYGRLLLHARHPEPGLPPGEEIARLMCRLAVREAQSLQKRRNRRSRREKTMDELPMASDPAATPGEAASRRELRDHIETLVRVLPERERVAVQLHYLHGMSQVEVAEMLAVDRSTVTRRIESGLKKLEKLARQAGLGEIGVSLVAIAGAGALIEPQSAMAAGTMLFHAQTAAAAMGTAGAGATILGKIFGEGVLSMKAFIVGSLALVGLVGTVGYHVVKQRLENTNARLTNMAATVKTGAANTRELNAASDALPAANRAEAASGNARTDIKPTPTLVVRDTAMMIRLIDENSHLPISGAQVVAVVAPDPPEGYFGAFPNVKDPPPLISDGDGVVQFEEGSKSKTLKITAPGYAPMQIGPELRGDFADGTNHLSIPLAHTVSLTGKAYIKGLPAAEATITANQDRRGPYREVQTKKRTDMAGGFTFDSLTEGIVTVTIYDRRHLAMISKKCKIGPGKKNELILGGDDDVENAAIYGQVQEDGKLSSGTIVSISPRFKSDYTEFTDVTGADGTYKILGLRPGEYWIQVSQLYPKEGNHDPSFPIQINGMTLRDFEIKSDHFLVKATLHMNTDLPARLKDQTWQVALRAVNQKRKSNEDDPDQLSQTIILRPNGTGLQSKGRLKGEYRVIFESIGNKFESYYGLDPPLQIDNLNHDVDLGVISLPKMGTARVRVIQDDANGPKAQTAVIAFGNPNAQGDGGSTRITANSDEQLVEGLPSGKGVAVLMAGRGFAVEPTAIPVTIGGTPPLLEFKIHPCFEFSASIYEMDEHSRKVFPLKRATLTGPGGTRTLIPETKPQSGFDQLLSKDLIRNGPFGSWVHFHDLPAGDFELTIEAEGYQTHHSVIHAALGKSEDLHIEMTKNPN